MTARLPCGRRVLSLEAGIFCAHAELLELCLTLSDPMDCILPGSSVLGILQARILEWVAVPSSRDIPPRGIPCFLRLQRWQL